MCTSIHFNNFFGRNLDLDFSYGEQVIITPRNFPFSFRMLEEIPTHYAIIGIGIISQGYPLYFDAMNEKGLCMAGLNFPDNACYLPICHGADNLAPFEFIPYILSKCATVNDARKLLTRINIADIAFSEDLPNTPLHWAIADREQSIVIEPLKNALKIYDNPIGVLTNNPTFDYHLTNLANYISVTNEEPKNRFSDKINLAPYSRGMGGIGIPGDLSSSSRFTRAAFTLLNSSECSLSQFFHILGSVTQQKGLVRVGDKYEYTLYSSCCDMEELIYYCTTYENPTISAVHLSTENLDSNQLMKYPIENEPYINHINKNT